MKKLFPIAIITVFAVLTFASSCTKQNNNPDGTFTCTCYFADSVSVDTLVIPTYPREPLNTAKTQCAYTQASYSGTSGYTVACSLNR